MVARETAGSQIPYCHIQGLTCLLTYSRPHLFFLLPWYPDAPPAPGTTASRYALFVHTRVLCLLCRPLLVCLSLTIPCFLLTLNMCSTQNPWEKAVAWSGDTVHHGRRAGQLILLCAQGRRENEC